MLPADYAIVIHGEIGVDLSSAFAPWTLSTAEGLTTIHAHAIDQAALHGIFDTVRSLGLTLVDVHRLGETG